MPTDSVDMVMGSPPYEAARTYGIKFNLGNEDWVKWAMDRYLECVRVCRGLVCWVVEGQTVRFEWSATPALLMADLHRAGVGLRKPPIYERDGVPGSGGPDWLRNRYEFCICSSKGRLPWSDNVAAGAPPKFPPGGKLSHHGRDGRIEPKAYRPPKLANPGNVIRCRSGGGAMGSPLAHENEAPYPEDLVEVFVRSFCPPGGIVLDPFSGSGTTVAVAKRNGRRWFAIDVRASQVLLTEHRLNEVEPPFWRRALDGAYSVSYT